MIILIGGEKGGTGKSTLAVNLAALRMLSGRDVLLVDADSQGSANQWAALRGDNPNLPRVSCVQKLGKGLRGEIADLAGRYQDIVIDAGGRDSVELRSGLTVAEKAIIPIQPSQFDLFTLDTMDQLVGTAEAFNDRLWAGVLINRASTNAGVKTATDAQNFVAELPNLNIMASVIRERIAFQHASAQGQCVIEYDIERYRSLPDYRRRAYRSKAAAELTALYEEIFENRPEIEGLDEIL